MNYFQWFKVLNKATFIFISNLWPGNAVCRMASQIGFNTRSDNGLVPDGTKPLPEPILIICEDLWHSPEGNFIGNTKIY